jgi:hypothetical protein
MRDLVAVQPMYGIANATFLRQHPEMAGSLWSTMVGVFTGGLAIVLAATRASGLERKYERQAGPSNRGVRGPGLGNAGSRAAAGDRRARGRAVAPKA